MTSKLFNVVAAIVLFSAFTGIQKSFNGEIRQMEVIPIADAVGPESVAFDPLGEGPYVGVSNGRILKWQENEQRWIGFGTTSQNRDGCLMRDRHERREQICGRPLGICFSEARGELYIADAYMGLMKLGTDGGLATPIATQADAVPFGFTNSLDISQSDGSIYFTDSSSIYQRRNYISVILSGDKTGRLMKYEQESQQVTVLLTNLSFPNGVALSQDSSFLVLSDTTNCRILRYWLTTPRAGSLETLAQLPGFPDNIRRSPRAGFWVAIHSRRTKLVSWILCCPKLCRALIWLLPVEFISRAHSVFSSLRGSGMAIRISDEGEVLETLEVRMSSISEVQEKGEHLWIGSINLPFLGLYRI